MPKVQDPILEQAKIEAGFWAKVERTEGCWLWTGAHNELGYGTVHWNGKTARVHRIAYELCVGPIPSGLTLDHLCRVRDCVKPTHLEAVTQKENTLRGETLTAVNHRKTHCPQGHNYDYQNTYISSTGERYCRACGRKPFKVRIKPQGLRKEQHA